MLAFPKEEDLRRWSLFLFPIYLGLIAVNTPDLLRLQSENKSFSEYEKKFQSGELCTEKDSPYAIQCLDGVFSGYVTHPDDVILLVRMQSLYQRSADVDLQRIMNSSKDFNSSRLMEYEINYLRIELALVKSLLKVEDLERSPYRMFYLRNHLNRMMGKFFATQWIPTLDSYFEGIQKAMIGHPEIDLKGNLELQNLKNQLKALEPEIQKCQDLNAFQNLIYGRLVSYLQAAQIQ